jgi:hypothetical protein
MFKYIHDPEFILQNANLIFINLTEPNNPQDFIMLMLAYLFKNTELAKEKVQTFIQALPETLNQSAMSTYDMIQNGGIEIGRQQERSLYESILAKERQLAVEATKLAVEERQLAVEERQRLDNTIRYLSQKFSLSPLDISVIVNKDVAYIEMLLALGAE